MTKENEETVYICSHNAMWVYHTERDCRKLIQARNVREVDKERIDLEKCKLCAGTAENLHQEGTEEPLKECPYCEEQVKSLAYHVPKCESTR